jgi:CBS-domain-containing membrane protein
MSLEGQAKRVRIYVNQGDLVGHTASYIAIIEFLRKEDAAGATVFRASEGFGSSGQLHTDRVVDLVGWSPVVVEWIDSAERVERLLERIEQMVVRGFITVDDTRVALYAPRRVRRVSDRLHAEDVMTRKPAFVAADASMREVVDAMRGQVYRAVPVVEDGVPIGIITNSDLVNRGGLALRLELLSGLSKPEQDVELSRIAENPKKARDIMSQSLVTVHLSTPLTEVADLMVHRRLKRLPVVGERDELVGMISRLDLLRTVSTGFQGDEPEPRLIGLNSDVPLARIMRRDVASVYPDTPAAEVMQAVIATRLNRVLVIDRERRVLGLVTDSELLERVTPSVRPSAIHSLMQRLPFVHPQPEQQQLEQHAQAKTARDLMSTVVTVVGEDEPVRTTIAAMLASKQKLVAITDKDRRLVGVIDRADILRGLIERV